MFWIVNEYKLFTFFVFTETNRAIEGVAFASLFGVRALHGLQVGATSLEVSQQAFKASLALNIAAKSYKRAASIESETTPPYKRRRLD